jgi:hypothetical protein
VNLFIMAALMTLTCAWRKAAKMSAQKAFLSLAARVRKKTNCVLAILAFCMGARL